MFQLTASERKAIIFVLGVFFLGVTLHFLLRVRSLNRFFYTDMLHAVETRAARTPVPIDINTASAEDLAEISGIGPVLAGRIVAYRKEHGRFQNREELTRVKGIGRKKLLQIQDSLNIP